MRFIIDVVPSDDKLEVTTAVAVNQTAGEYRQIVDLKDLADSVGAGVRRIYDRNSDPTTPPEGMRRVKATVVWTAESEIEVDVAEGAGTDLEAVEAFIEKNGLPEVVNNPTLQFMFANELWVGDDEVDLDD